jgi:hypothetical protein
MGTKARWPPRKGELWFTADRWEATDLEPEVPAGHLVLILGGAESKEGWTSWWGGEVLGPLGKRFVKATRDDLIPGDDPRLVAPEFNGCA